MKNNGFKKKRRFDIFIIMLVLIILGFALSIDRGVINNLPDNIWINEEMAKDIMLNVFAAQASVSTLGIALISILGGIVKDKIYGISISQYLMEDRPLIFKHKVNIIIQLILIVFSYIFMSLEIFNLLIGIFFTSIIIVCMMVWDIFIIFYGNEYIRKEIHEYFLSIFDKSKSRSIDKRKTLLKSIKKDTLISVDIGDTVVLKENLNLFSDILEKISLNYYDDNNEVFEQWEDSVSDIFNKILKDGDINKIIIVLENIQSMYEKCNDINNNTNIKDINIHLNILDNVARYIFLGMANIILSESDDYHIIFNLEYYLYDNLDFKYIEGKLVPANNNYLNIYSGRIYYEILNKGIHNYNPRRLFEVKKWLYKEIEQLISYNSFKGFKQEKIKQLYTQLYQYTRVLIDNGENQVLEETLFRVIDDIGYEYNEEKIEYIFIILIYLYYLINIESLADDKLKNDCRDLIKSNIIRIKNFLFSQYRFKVSKEFIEKATVILDRWEMMPEEEAKCFVMYRAIEEFIIFYILERNYNVVDLTNQIKTLIEGKERSIYMNIIDNSLVKKYTEFINMFYNKNINEEQCQEKMDLLKISITNLYKEREIIISKENIKIDKELNTIKTQIKDICIKNIESTTKIFNKNKTECTISKEVKLLNLKSEIELLNDNNIKNYINSIINRNLVMNILETTKGRLKEEVLNNGNKEILQRFFSLKRNIYVDTLIGYRSNFYGLEGELEFDFREFEKDKFKIKSQSQYCSNCIVAIESSKFYFNVKDIEVKMKCPTIDELGDDVKIKSDGDYLYRLNDIYIPFTKDELERYINNCKRLVTIEAKIEYGFSDDIIGVGVFIDNNKK